MRQDGEFRDAVTSLVAGLLPAADVSFEEGPVGVDVVVREAGELVCTAYVGSDHGAAHALVHVGNVVQDAAIERRGRAVPECPGHSHPAVLRLGGGESVEWVCPELADPGDAPAVAH